MNSWIGWIAIISVGTIVQAQVTHESFMQNTLSQTATTTSSERWLQPCGLFGRNRDDDKDNDGGGDNGDGDNDGDGGGGDNERCRVCNSDDLELDPRLAEIEPGCTCNKCTEPYDFFYECEDCTICTDGIDLCINYKSGKLFNVDSEEIVRTNRITATGADSANNEVFFERSPNGDIQLTLNGVRCNSYTPFNIVTGCFIIDCSNVENGGGYWTCVHGSEIEYDSRHPMYAAFAFSTC